MRTELFTPDPVNRQHPLCKNIRNWWMALPHNAGGKYLYDLMGCAFGTITNTGTHTVWEKRTSGGTTTPPIRESYSFPLYGGASQQNSIAITGSSNLTAIYSISAWAATFNTSPDVIIIGADSSNYFGLNTDFPDFTGAGIILKIAGTSRSSALSLPFASWNHVGVTQNGANTLFYYNGKLLTTASSLSGVFNPLKIGYNGVNTAPSNFDDIKIFGTALTSAEWLELYNQDRSPYSKMLNWMPTRRHFLGVFTSPVTNKQRGYSSVLNLFEEEQKGFSGIGLINSTYGHKGYSPVFNSFETEQDGSHSVVVTLSTQDRGYAQNLYLDPFPQSTKTRGHSGILNSMTDKWKGYSRVENTVDNKQKGHSRILFTISTADKGQANLITPYLFKDRGYSRVLGNIATTAGSKQAGRARIKNTTAGYLVWIGEDALPNLEADPDAFSATLPFNISYPLPGAGTITLNIVIRKVNEHGLVSQNQRPMVIMLDSAGLVRNDILAPVGVTAVPIKTLKFRILAKYPRFSFDTNPADKWRVWIDTVSPNVNVDTPEIEVNVLSENLSTNSAILATGHYFVAVALFRTIDSRLSEPTIIEMDMPDIPDEPIPVSTGFVVP